MKDIFASHAAEYETPPACAASAPAVVKLLGEHTAPSEGLVLTAAISCEVKVAVSLRKDSSLRFFAADLGERKRASAGTLKYKREDRWANHVKSIYDYLSREYNLQGKGINVTLTSSIPQGLGLGTTAAINMASLLALKSLFPFPCETKNFRRSRERPRAFFSNLLFRSMIICPASHPRRARFPSLICAVHAAGLHPFSARSGLSSSPIHVCRELPPSRN